MSHDTIEIGGAMTTRTAESGAGEARGGRERDESARNVRTVHRLLEAADAGDLEAVETCFSTCYVDHDPAFGPRPGQSDLEGAMEAYRCFLGAFPDAVHTLHEVVAQGSRVAIRISAEGTQTGGLLGVPPTGRRFRNDALVLYRFEDGRIVERWARGRDRTFDRVRRAAEAEP